MRLFAVVCACWAVDGSSSFLLTRASPTVVASHVRATALPLSSPTQRTGRGHHNSTGSRHRHHRCSAATRIQQHRSPTTMMLAGEGRRHSGTVWLSKVASAALAFSILVGVWIDVPADAGAAAKPPKQEPVVQALVQLPDEESDWTRLLSDMDQAPGAKMVITASERGEKPSLGASIPMDRLRFPVMMQLFPKNVIGGASWPGDFDEKGTYAVEVVVCGPGKATGGVCESPLPVVGSGESIFVAGVEDVPEIAESGGMRVPATVVLTAPSSRILAPPL